MSKVPGGRRAGGDLAAVGGSPGCATRSDGEVVARSPGSGRVVSA
ncbi:hypothetical protein [Nocardia salmonicida]